MKTPQNQLAVVETSVKPKPTKSEIIEALALRKQEQYKQDNLKRAARRKEIDALVKEKIEAHVKRNFDSLPFTVTIRGYSPGYVDFGCDFTTKNKVPADVLALCHEYAKCEDIRIPKLKDIQDEIRHAMTGSTPRETRIAAILAAPECVKALDAMIKKIEDGDIDL